MDPLTIKRKKKKNHGNNKKKLVCECDTAAVQPPASGLLSSLIPAASRKHSPFGRPPLNTSVWLPLATGMIRSRSASLPLLDAASLRRTVAEDEDEETRRRAVKDATVFFFSWCVYSPSLFLLRPPHSPAPPPHNCSYPLHLRHLRRHLSLSPQRRISHRRLSAIQPRFCFCGDAAFRTLRMYLPLKHDL